MSSVSSDPAYEPVIGLEVHAQLLTESKAFCGCSTKFGNSPNTNVCPVCLGLPGALPVLNKRAVEFAIRMALATSSSVSPRSVFARKNYFYPDLPKGYQISQYADPICTGGFVDIEPSEQGHEPRRIVIARIHLEEDAGKSIHDRNGFTLVDINRCGVPLLELVSEPDLRSPHEASLYLRKIRQLVTYLGICDGNMEEGNLRCDANISVRRKGYKRFGTKTELKNLNSFRNVERALEFEMKRQIRALEGGERIKQETMLWDAEKNVALPMRSKEEAHDYRYFPEPDLVPVVVDKEWTAEIRAALPEHPTARRDRFVHQYALRGYDADVLTAEKEYADFFEEAVKSYGARNNDEFKQVSNWVMTEVLRVAGEGRSVQDRFPVSPDRLARLIRLVADGTVSGRSAKEVFAEMLLVPDDPRSIVEKKGLVQLSDEAVLERIIDDVLVKYPSHAEKYRAGNEKLLGYFVGRVMEASKGKANPALVNHILVKKLSRTKSF